MSTQHHIPFHFHALGHALSGTFHRPFDHVIPAQAATSLPSIGGHANALIENFRSHHFVTFKAGHTHVSGSWMDENTVVTSATAVLEGLNILEFITADRVVARLTSEGKHGQKESHIIAVGSEFENLRIGGHPVNVTLRHDLFLKCPTHEDLRKAVASDKKSGKIVATDDGATLCSLVEKIETNLPGAEIKGHILRIPHFGEVSLAEVFAVPGTRTLTMLRLKLGSPDGGLLTGCEVLSQGQPMPPVS
ncbi:MAG TPA: choice-of-anchor P family protein [Candidatus Acidoferrum sp.]|nr:choice-of-anchor P family protein [Candidatus Acidoferrum sp.]